ncbi:MAG: helicase-associated domain-containing protein [Clostridiales bacterium]|nr:helicase-associated domain-containing protein [Clostridiales bacterium]
MHTKKQIERWLLSNCSLSRSDRCAAGTGMDEIHQRVFGNKKNVARGGAARDLAAFYAEPQNIMEIWGGGGAGAATARGLTDIEKEFISAYVQLDCAEFVPATKVIADRHGIAPPKEKRSWGSDNFYSPDEYYGKRLKFLHIIVNERPKSMAVCLFPGGEHMPPFVSDVLKDKIPPMEFVYGECAPSENDRLICREGRLADFAAAVRFAGIEKLKVKEGTYDITKAKFAKMAETAGFDEVCDIDGAFGAPKDAARAGDFRVAAPLFALAAAGGLIEIGGDLCARPSKDAVKLLLKPPHELAKHLLDQYCARNRIREPHYVAYLEVNGYWIDWTKCREQVIGLLKTCPVGRFVKFSDFCKYALIFCGNFLGRPRSGSVGLKGFDFGYDYYYDGSYTPDWDECEGRIIAQVLTFLGAIGAVDVAYAEGAPRIKHGGDDFGVGISALRVTALGAWLFGMTDKYDAPKAAGARQPESRLLVQPDHTVMIAGLESRILHETYLGKFLTKVSDDANVSVYKINFQSVVRAHNLGIRPRQIKEYLKKASDRPLPKNVERSFDDWQAKAGRVKIRTVTILETDDRLLLAELKAIKDMGVYAKVEIGPSLELAYDGAQKKAKALAEKNGWLVDL